MSHPPCLCGFPVGLVGGVYCMAGFDGRSWLKPTHHCPYLQIGSVKPIILHAQLELVVADAFDLICDGFGSLLSLIAPAWPYGPANGVLARGGARCGWPPPLLAFALVCVYLVRFYFESVEMLTRR